MKRALLLIVLGVAVPVSGLNLKVDFRWHDRPVEIPAKGLVTPAGETIEITRLDFLLNQPELTLESGRAVTASKWHAYVHGEKPEILRFPNLPAESISKLTLNLGPSDDINGVDPNQFPAGHPLNALHNGLHWDPQQGYIFIAVEGRLPGEDLAFAYHYGNSKNRLVLAFDGPLDPGGFHRLTLHLDRLFPAPFRIAERTSTHSREGDPLVDHFREVLPGAFTLEPIQGPAGSRSDGPEAAVELVGTPQPFTLPRNFPLPQLPTDHPLTSERVELGRQLFFDPRLSGTGTVSCASCHDPTLAFSDPEPFSIGHAGEKSARHSMPLVNLAWKTPMPFRWDGDAADLREQILRPIADPVEMGGDLETLPKKLADEGGYAPAFEDAFGDPEITTERVAVSIEQYLLTQTSFDSKFDRAAKGEVELSKQEQKGFELFMTENDPRLGLRGADCFHCHSGAFFTNHRFHNNGLPPANGDLGLELATGRETDRFRFSTPSLRNVAITAPYMHDGRFATLEEVVDFYSEGVHRSPTLDPNIAKHRGKGLDLTDDEKAALVAFLKTLTDPRYEADE